VLVVASVDGVVEALVVVAAVLSAVDAGVALAVVAGSGFGVGSVVCGGGVVSGTGSVCTGPGGGVEEGPPSAVCPRTPALERINMIAVTAPSSAAGAM
jgi:hypothetical protein